MTQADIVIAIIFFTSAFNYLFGLIVLVTMVIYLGKKLLQNGGILWTNLYDTFTATTVYMTEWRTKYRRSMNLADNDQRTKSVDSMLNFETVKYFGAEPYEIDRYSQAILSYQVEKQLLLCAALITALLIRSISSCRPRSSSLWPR